MENLLTAENLLKMAMTLMGWVVLFVVTYLTIRSKAEQQNQNLQNKVNQAIGKIEGKLDSGVVTWTRHNESLTRVHLRVDDVEKESGRTFGFVKEKLAEIGGDIKAIRVNCRAHRLAIYKLENTVNGKTGGIIDGDDIPPE